MSNNNIKNADMPAMPQPMVMDEDGNTYTTFDNYHGEQGGLTKREMFAMNANLKEYVENMDILTLLDFLGLRYPENLTDIEIIKYRLQAEAKLAVVSADARLAELET